MRIHTFLLILLLAATNIANAESKTIKPVIDFELERYLGTWYEIARLDNFFERGLQRVQAEYSLRDDGKVRVINKGYSTKNNKWKKAKGKAYLAGEKTEGYLKVSFFGPFYSPYIIFELDHQAYEYAFVAGKDRSYLWFLARTPVVSEDLMNHFIKTARNLGFDMEKLVIVDHSNE